MALNLGTEGLSLGRVGRRGNGGWHVVNGWVGWEHVVLGCMLGGGL